MNAKSVIEPRLLHGVIYFQTTYPHVDYHRWDTTGRSVVLRTVNRGREQPCLFEEVQFFLMHVALRLVHFLTVFLKEATPLHIPRHLYKHC